MTRREYEIPDLSEPAQALLAGPPWWLHAILFGLSVLLMAAAVMFIACVAG
jgi:hypothetical protein